MRYFKNIFSFEALRYSKARWLFLVFFVFCLIIVLDGFSDYNRYKKSVNSFVKAEKEKVSQYIVYSQYGGFGAGLICEPSMFSILNNSNSFEIVANVNMAERLSIYIPAKGKSFLSENSIYLSFLGFFLLFGITVSVFFGYLATRQRLYLSFLSNFSASKKVFLSTIFSRAILVNLTFSIFLILSVFFVFLGGVNLFNINLLPILLVGSLVITAFLFLGALIGSLSDRLKAFSLTVLVIFIFAFAIPLIIGKWSKIDFSQIDSIFDFNSQNSKLYAKVEEKLIDKFGVFKRGEPVKKGMAEIVRKAIDTEYKMLRARERALKLETLRKVKSNHFLSSLFPTSFYFSVSREVSTSGGLVLVDFFSFVETMKNRFINSYFREKFLLKGKEGKGLIEPFFKDDEIVFIARPRLPHAFTLGIVITLLYIIGFFLWSWRRMDRQLKPGAGLNPDIVIEKGSTCFVLCENEETKKQIFDYYRQTGTAAVIGKIDPAQFPNVSPVDTAKHFARITGVHHDTVMRNLEIMGVDFTKGTKNEPDFKKKVYAAVMCAADRETLVVDDFLKQESRDFENGFLQLLANLVNDGKKILYLSCEYFESQKNLNDKIKVEGFESFEIEDIEKVTLR